MLKNNGDQSVGREIVVAKFMDDVKNGVSVVPIVRGCIPQAGSVVSSCQGFNGIDEQRDVDVFELDQVEQVELEQVGPTDAIVLKVMNMLENETPVLQVISRPGVLDPDRSKCWSGVGAFNPNREMVYLGLTWRDWVSVLVLVHKPYGGEPVDSWFIETGCLSSFLNVLVDNGRVDGCSVDGVVKGWLGRLAPRVFIDG